MGTLKKITRNSLPNNLSQKEEDFSWVKDTLFEKDYLLFEKMGNVFFPISLTTARVKGLLEYNDDSGIFYFIDFEREVIIDKKWAALVYGATGCNFVIEGQEFKFTKEELSKDDDEEDED
jgi:hypothetical protein